jgi:hypothetical protein
VTSYPIPRKKEQPPNKALCSPHPAAGLYDVGLLATPYWFTFDDIQSLIPGFDNVDVPLNKGEHVSKCAEGLRPEEWLTVEVTVPYAPTLPKCREFRVNGDPSPPSDLAGPVVRRQSFDTRRRDVCIRRGRFGTCGHLHALLYSPSQLCSSPRRTTTHRFPKFSVTVSRLPVFARFFFFRLPRHYAHDAPVPYS